MNKEFVPYQQALELKELGFNEPCFGFYYSNGKFIQIHTIGFPEDKKDCVLSPLYQQAFRFFREKYNLRSFIDTRVYDVDSPNQWIYDYQIKMGNGIDIQPFFSGDFDSYEEAELACLIKLIEIVKQQK